MNSNPICHPSPANKMKCSFLDYVQLLMISRACWWTWTPSTTCLQPKNEMLIFWLCSTSDDWPDWSMDSNPIHHPSPAKKMKCSFLYYVQLLMISWAGKMMDFFKPHLKLCLPPLSSQKNEMLIFVLCSTSDDQLGWSMDSNPICHPSPAKTMKCSFLYYIQHLMLARLVNGLEPHPPPLSSQKMKCSFLGYVQLLMISRAVRWTQTPSASPLQPIKWNAHILIMFNFWWSARLVDGLKPHLPPSPANKMKCFFLDYVHFWWSARLVDGLKPHLPPLSSQRNEMLIFVLCSTSNDQLGWSMDSNPIHHPSPAKTVKCSILYYIQHLMLARLVNGLEPHPPPLSSQKNEMLIFGLQFNFWWSAGIVNGLEPH